MSNQFFRKYLDILNETSSLDEKWDQPTKVSPEERGKYAGKSKAELLKSYNALKKSGPHHRGSPEFGRMRELAFAIRAKGGWGKVAENYDDEGIMSNHLISKEQARYTDHGVSPQVCAACEHFEAPNSCGVVIGTVSPGGWCKYFKFD